MGSDVSRSRHHRKAARVLPLPVGAAMSTWRPEATSCQPRSCTCVGPSNELRNQSRVAGANRSRELPTHSSLTRFRATNKRSLTGHVLLSLPSPRPSPLRGEGDGSDWWEGHAMYPFERFNEQAKMSLTLAQEEAERSHHSYIGTGHLLLGLLRVQQGTAYRVLNEVGVDIVPVRELINSVLGPNNHLLAHTTIPTSLVHIVL